MFIRPCYKKSNGKKLAYWAREQLCCDQHLVESYRTAKGPRHRIVAYLGQLKDGTRRAIKQLAEGKHSSQENGTQEGKDKPQFVQARLFNDDQLNIDQLDNNPLEVEWVEINANGVRVENEKAFGCPWLALQLVKLLGLDEFLTQHLPSGEERVPWSLVLVTCRLLNPSSELFTITNRVIPKARPFTLVEHSQRRCSLWENGLPPELLVGIPTYCGGFFKRLRYMAESKSTRPAKRSGDFFIFLVESECSIFHIKTYTFSKENYHAFHPPSFRLFAFVVPCRVGLGRRTGKSAHFAGCQNGFRCFRLHPIRIRQNRQRRR